MCKLILSAVCAAALGVLSTSPAAATVTFDFYWAEPGYTPAPSGLEFTISNPTESGSATWLGDPLQPPNVSDPSFSLGVPGDAPVSGPDFGYDSTCLTTELCTTYDITWNAVDGTLTALNLSVSGLYTTLGPHFGIDGGPAGSDDPEFLGGGGCCVTGYWQAALPGGGLVAPLPEPGSMPLLVTALLGLGVVRLRERPRGTDAEARAGGSKSGAQFAARPFHVGRDFVPWLPRLHNRNPRWLGTPDL